MLHEIFNTKKVFINVNTAPRLGKVCVCGKGEVRVEAVSRKCQEPIKVITAAFRGGIND